MPILFEPKKQPAHPVQKITGQNHTKPVEDLTASVPPGSHVEVMGAYVTRPSGIHFATQAAQEQILLILRRHPITQLPWVLFAGLLVLLPLFLSPFLSGILNSVGIPLSYQIILLLFWYLAMFSFMLTNFVLWYFNVNIVTNLRVLDIDFPSLLIQEVNGTHIEQIEDVSFKRVGVLAAIADYGDVHVQTAGPVSNIEFLQVPHPKQVIKIILDLMGNV